MYCTINRESNSKFGISGRMDGDRLHLYYRTASLDAKMYHTIEQITNLEENSNEVHVETITTRMKRDNDDLSTIMSTNVNPFRAQGSFVRLLTNITIPDDIVKKVLNSGSAGAHQTTDFITKRLLTTQENYDKRISNNKLRTLASFEP
ncbi:unnamed protein product, partial [Didymodactylos carnosus]